MPRQTKADGWTPRRRGLIYCSPRCGCGCTRAAYDKAHKDGASLARRLGSGWTIDVWENMGWHYQVQSPCGRVRLSSSKGAGYLAFLGDRDSSGGRWAEHGETPEEAIQNVARVAVAELHKIGALILDMPHQARLPRGAFQIEGRRR